MTGPSLMPRCVVCGAPDRPLEQHHLALRSNHHATVDLCTPCHRGQTKRQHDAGILRPTESSSGPELTVMRGLLVGFWGIFDAFYRSRDDLPFSEELEVRNDEFFRVTTRLIGLASEELPGSLGSRPIANDRGARTRHPVETAPGATAEETGVALAVQVLPTIAAVISSVLPDDAVLFPGITVQDVVELCSPSRMRTLALNVIALEADQHLAEAEPMLEQDVSQVLAVMKQLNGACANQALNGLDEAEVGTRRWGSAAVRGDCPRLAHIGHRDVDLYAGTGAHGSNAAPGSPPRTCRSGGVIR